MCLVRLMAGFILGVLRFILFVDHLLGILLSLEFLVLIVFSLIGLILWESCLYTSILFLIFRVCEGVLGLTILVAIARAFGVETLNSFSLVI